MTTASDSYEQLVQEIYQALVNQDDVANIDVQHNVTLTGMSGATHQIDVYWEFQVGGAVYRTIIECRRYKSHIKKDQVAAIKGILCDLAPGTTAIMVTTQGYQSGALLYAQHHGVRLMKANLLLRTLVVDMTFIHTRIRNVRLIHDEKHASEVLEAAGLKHFPFQFRGTAKDIRFVNADGQPVTTLHDLTKGKVSEAPGEHVIKPADHYLPTDIGPIRLAEVRFEAVHEPQKVEYVFDGINIAKAFIECVQDGSTQYLHPDGTISDRSE